MTHYSWSGSVLIDGCGLHDVRGAFRTSGTQTEAALKAAVARGVAAEQNRPTSEITVIDFTYTELP